MLSIIGAILAIGLLIVVHEAGHYFVARWCKMRVDRFSIGFGPAIIKWRRGETDFTIGPIPFGGFVQINGMLVADEVDPDDERSYPNRPVGQRFATIFAGPATNYLFAIVLAFGLYIVAGVETGTAYYSVSDVTSGQGYDAEGKLETGDRFVKVNGEPVFAVYQDKAPTIGFTDRITEARGEPVTFTVLRDGKELDIAVKPSPNGDQFLQLSLFELIHGNYVGADSPADPLGGALWRSLKKEPPYRVGIVLTAEDERKSVGFFGSLGRAFTYPVRQTRDIAVGMYDMARGKVKGTLMGPLGIGDVIKQSIEFGWIRVLQLLMLLNVYLGLFNLFPLPALDGGRLVFLGYEMATRRRANPKVEATVHMVGIMALLVVMVLVTYKDIVRVFF